MLRTHDWSQSARPVTCSLRAAAQYVVSEGTEPGLKIRVVGVSVRCAIPSSPAISLTIRGLA